MEGVAGDLSAGAEERETIELGQFAADKFKILKNTRGTIVILTTEQGLWTIVAVQSAKRRIDKTLAACVCYVYLELRRLKEAPLGQGPQDLQFKVSNVSTH